MQSSKHGSSRSLLTMLTYLEGNWTSCDGAQDGSENRELENYGKDNSFGAVEVAANNAQKEIDSPSLRKLIGSSMGNVSDLINDNLIAARYGTMATILLLTAYGISNSPLLFRFRTVSEIPGKFQIECSTKIVLPASFMALLHCLFYSASYFKRRRSLHCRIINVNKAEDNQLLLQRNSNSANAIHVTVRHLSPIGQILPKAWFDFFMRMNPIAVRLAKENSSERPEGVKTEVLWLELGELLCIETNERKGGGMIV